jgi:ring-1,2-phenylacetyl-CoA epoxidase subunit PaaD
MQADTPLRAASPFAPVFSADNLGAGKPGCGRDVPLSAVWQLLEQVPDPEIPVVSIRELGILRDVRRLDDGVVEVVITPTYSGCPAIGQIEDDIRAALAGAGFTAKVTTQLAPAWTTDWIDQTTRDKLKSYGIAPPHTVEAAQKGGYQPIQFATKSIANNSMYSTALGRFYSLPVKCPRCSSQNTTETSHFASTACKALYKCLDCLEPFDYFKPY